MKSQIVHFLFLFYLTVCGCFACAHGDVHGGIGGGADIGAPVLFRPEKKKLGKEL